jgi:alpha-tubulin suppressor-like RCC1 family protein
MQKGTLGWTQPLVSIIFGRFIMRCFSVRSIRSVLPPLALLSVLSACEDPPSPLTPEASGNIPGQVVLQKLSCTADVGSGAVSCEAGPALPEGLSRITLGANYARISSSNNSYQNGIYTIDVTVQNLIPQTLGVGADGLPDGNGVNVVFLREPVADKGKGTITVNNALRGNFTRTNELYYRYDQTLAPGETSAPKQWSFSVPPTVVRFSFSVYVSASVQYPHGWIEIAGAPTLQVARGGTLPLTAVVRDSVGRDITSSAGLVWSLADPSVGTISGSTLTAAATAGYTTLSAVSGARSASVQIIVGSAFTQIVAGTSHTCGLDPLGRAWCWGWNVVGQLGDSTTVNRSVPVQVRHGATRFVKITAGYAHTCALTSAGQAYCWGNNGSGQLGDKSLALRLTPVAVQQGTSVFTRISAGDYHTCALSSAGQTYCWGNNRWGQIGNGGGGRFAPAVWEPSAVQQTGAYIEVTAGGSHNCGLSSTGQAYCWGRNDTGAIGNGGESHSSRPSPVRQSGISYIQITAGGLHTCALASTGKAYCWGSNNQRQLADGSRQRKRTTPVAVWQGDLTFVEITAGDQQTCARASTGYGYCWYSAGFLQEGSLQYAEITAGGLHACVRTPMGQAYCRGVNGYGQLGDNTTDSRTILVAVQ